jgi:hypothetical protein
MLLTDKDHTSNTPAIKKTECTIEINKATKPSFSMHTIHPLMHLRLERITTQKV